MDNADAEVVARAVEDVFPQSKQVNKMAPKMVAVGPFLLAALVFHYASLPFSMVCPSARSSALLLDLRDCTITRFIVCACGQAPFFFFVVVVVC